MRNTFRGLLLALGLWIPCARTVPTAPDAGVVHFIRNTNPAFDRYTKAPDLFSQEWIRSHFWRMVVFSPYFDTKLRWYPNGLSYLDAYAIYTGSGLAAQHADWILKDSAGHRLYIPWGCSGGTCPQYAADISNQAFRQWWISQAQSVLSKGYKGLFLDDVNMEFRVSNGTGSFIDPIDSNTGAAMTWDHWRLYMAEFMEQIRAALPGAELVHNSIWYSGPTGVRNQDPSIQRQIAAADRLNIEFGVNDTGLTGGNGPWSLNSLLGYIDFVHAAGKGVVMGGVASDPAGREYALANYYLISTGADALGDTTTTPNTWWRGFETDLGTPSGPRMVWNGLLRRDYSGGMVLVNAPQSPAVTVNLPGEFHGIDGGTAIASLTLGPANGAVLLKP